MSESNTPAAPLFGDEQRAKAYLEAEGPPSVVPTEAAPGDSATAGMPLATDPYGNAPPAVPGPGFSYLRTSEAEENVSAPAEQAPGTGSLGVHGPRPGPADAVLTDAAPVTRAPTDTVPTDTGPVTRVPADTVPTDTGPVTRLPADTVPTDTGPVTRVSTVAASEARPAQWGWRAKVRKGTVGLVSLPPDEQELAHRRAETTIRQATWTRAVNIVVANPKGGVGKTPVAVILAGILGQVRGGYVAAFEAAESIGTLARRAEGEPVRGLAELLAGVGDIRSAGHLGGYTAPQTSHSDVIGSVGRRAVLSGADVVAVRRVLDTYYRMTVTDTGNNPGHPAFLAAARTADAAVLPCLVSIDALAGVEEALSIIHEVSVEAGTGLHERVVVILSHDGGPEDPALAAVLRKRLGELDVSAVLEVPFDPSIRRGGEITISALSVASQRAWMAAAAAVVHALKTAPTSTDLVTQLLAQLSAAPVTRRHDATKQV